MIPASEKSTSGDEPMSMGMLNIDDRDLGRRVDDGKRATRQWTTGRGEMPRCIYIHNTYIQKYIHTYIHTYIRRYFQHAHFIPIVGVGKSETHINWSMMTCQSSTRSELP